MDFGKNQVVPICNTGLLDAPELKKYRLTACADWSRLQFRQDYFTSYTQTNTPRTLRILSRNGFV